MALVQDLFKKYSQMLQPVQQGLSNIGRGIQQGAQNVGNFVSQDIQRAPIVQQYNNIQRVAPQIQGLENRVVNTRFIPGQVNTLNQVGQNVLKNPNQYNLYSQMQQGNLKTGFKPLDTAGQLAGSYVQNKMVQPLSNVFTGTSQALNPKNTLQQRGGGLLSAGLGGLQTGMNLTPAGSAWNLGFSALDSAKARQYSKLHGGNAKDQTNAADQGFVGNKTVGLGDALTKNKYFAMLGNGVEFAAPLLHGGVSSLKGGADAAALRDVSPNAFNIHPEDEKLLNNYMDRILNKGEKLQGPEMKDLQNLAEHYLGEKFRAQNNQKIAQAFEHVLALKNGGFGTKLPIPSLVDGEVSSKGISETANQESKTIGKAQSLPPQIDQLLNPQGKKEIGSANGQTIGNNSSSGIIPSTAEYLQQLEKSQNDARNVDKGGLIQKGQGLLADIKRKLVDSTAPIEDILANAQKEGKFTVLPKNDISPQIDRAIRSHELAGQFLKDNGMVDVLKGVPDVNALDQYLIAKHAPEVAAQGFKTGRNIEADKKLVQELAPVYEPYAQKVTAYGQKLLDYAVQSGLVNQETATALKQKYPNYVPLNRIFNELEKGSVPEGVGKGVASLSKQTVVKGLQGSERAIQNPTESLLTKTMDAFSQGERNIAGKQLASYKDLPGNPFGLTELKSGESAPHTISFLDNGVKKTYSTTPEVAQAAKFLDKRQLGLIGQMFALPVRLARVGITGINIPFVGANLAKDQVSAFINSDHALQTSIANPSVFLKAAWTAIGHGKEFDNWVRNAGGGTSFDLSRSEPNVSINQIRAGRNVGSKIAYTATHPGELLRAVENVVGRGEEATRLQAFIGTRDALLKEGRTLEDANILAAKAARENTVNFGRSGDWGKALNSVFLYMNAGIQGSRTLMRNLQTRPAQTAAKIGLTVMTPVAAVTAWNLADPQRKAAYDDIRDFEKDNNLVIVPPNPTKDANGKWNVIKVPYSQEVANLTVPLRKGIEALHGADGPGFGDFASAIIGSTTSLNAKDPQQLFGQFIPQAVKPGLEATLNKNTFTGADIVPKYINGQESKNLSPDMQAYPTTSGTARKIAGPLNVSPIKVEQFIKSAAGGVGSQVLNASDQALAAAGVIPKEQIGGQSIAAGLEQRFQKANGGQELTNMFDNKAPKGTNSSGMTDTGTKVVENNGKFYISLGNGNVKSFDSKEKAQNVLVTRDNKTIDLSPPTTGSGIDAFTNKDWNITKARDVFKANLPEAQKQAAYQKLGVDPSGVEYDYKASHNTDVKSQYIAAKAPTESHEMLMQDLVNGRVKSISGAIFASNGVLDSLAQQGIISDQEAKYLKSVQYDRSGKNIGTSAKGKGGRKGKKVKAISIKMPRVRALKTPKIKVSKVKQYNLAKIKSTGLKKVSRIV